MSGVSGLEGLASESMVHWGVWSGDAIGWFLTEEDIDVSLNAGEGRTGYGEEFINVP